MKRYTRTMRAAAAIGAAAALTAAAGCNRDRLLGVTDPGVIDPNNLNSAAGSEGLRIGALTRFKWMTAYDESSWFYGGMLVDEWKSADTFTQRDETDQRVVTEENSLVTVAYRDIHRARVEAYQAAVALQMYQPDAIAKIGEMWFVKGYAELQSASDFCNGQPFALLTATGTDYGPAISGADAYAMALASFDSALAAVASATDSMSLRVKYSAQVGRGRALLNIGRPAEAAAAVTGVKPFSFNLTWPASQGKEDNGIWTLNVSAKRYTVQDSADTQGGTIPNGMPFVSARDPRVATTRSFDKKGAQTTGFDGKTPLDVQGVFPLYNSPVPVANYVDAQLILAEAQLAAGNAAWLTTLDALRAGPTNIGALTISGMAPLVDPGTDDARRRLLFRERAFWTFGRGERLGDLRRLIRIYKMTPAQIFPGEGGINPRKGAAYGHDLNLPVPQAERNNPQFTGCTDRNA
jgi:hypothetical protein